MSNTSIDLTRKALFTKLAEAIDSVVEIDRYLDAGDHVIAVGHTRGTARATGKQFQVPAVHVWTFRDGSAVRFEAYIDNPAMMRALRP